VSRTWVWVVVAQFMVVNAALVGGVMVLGPAIADGTIGRQSWGLVLAAQTFGLVVGGLVALRWQPRRALRLGVGLTIVEALPLLALARAPTVVGLVIVMFTVGLAMEQFGVAWDVSLQENVPPDRLARVYSYDMLGSFIAIPIGEIVVGPIAETYGTDAALVGGAVLVALATVLALCSRSVRTLERHGDPAAVRGAGTGDSTPERGQRSVTDPAKA
jgi:predicted MFS family arabinose efflux permease